MPIVLLADISFPTKTQVHFTKNHQPYNKSVDYTVSCYGYIYLPGEDPNYDPGNYVDSLIYSYSANCTNSDSCIVEEPYYLNYRHINYCRLDGVTPDGDFTIANIGDSPVDFTACEQNGVDRFCETTFEMPMNFNESVQTTANAANLYSNFPLALAITIVVETILLWVLLQIIYKKKSDKPKHGKIIFTGIISSALTLPYLWFVSNNWIALFIFNVISKQNGGWSNYLPTLAGEIIVMLVEAFIINQLLNIKYRRALWISVVCNVGSFAVGLMVAKLFF
ncbi:MAG: hypothetical protein V1898_02615 [Patescibacteria group bacterium]